VASSSDGVVDESEFGLDLCELVSEASAVVVVAMVSLDLCNGVPIVKVRYCLA